MQRHGLKEPKLAVQLDWALELAVLPSLADPGMLLIPLWTFLLAEASRLDEHRRP